MRVTLKQAAALGGRLYQAGERELQPSEVESARALGVLDEATAPPEPAAEPASAPTPTNKNKRRKA